ncbi:XdhC family protein [Pontibacter pamirensis]|uniref:XdhC family protein n=1 Tax=Pontibacter pamirensis TaxID=2562824 RepID=UPI00138A0600|nr:XdhC/CoxI family protein [Pontibacter pamirensis]
MKEVQDIVRAFEEAQKEGKQTALATVVHVQGSSYRRPGARMLVTEDGKLTGAISGGCLEGDALRKARLAMVQQKAMLVTYDTTDDDDAKLGVGLGCNGIIQILIEPINPESPQNPVALLQSFLSNRQHAVMVTLFSLDYQATVQPGTCLIISEGGAIIGGFQDKSLEKALIADAQQVLQEHVSMTKTYATPQTALTGFIELLKPAVSLIIAGAGNDAIPVTQMAAILGWQTTVVDGRANYATAERFPSAHNLIVAKPEQVLPKLKLDEQTVFVLMTHNYNYDTAMLRQLLPLHMPYIGVLGPKKKLERMLEELQEEGMQLSEEELKSIFGPVGLDVGAETSEEIALAIVSEIKAVLSKRAGTSLRDKQDVIHSREAEKINQVTLK